MELVQKTARDRFESASAALSKHCYDAGRLHFVITLEEEALERKRLQLRNLKVDFDRLNKDFQKATDEYLGAEKAASSPAELPQ